MLTIFVSAALLFSVQPMFAKMVLPRLGGSPGVWSVAMVVFQSLLLAGYAYAHALGRIRPMAQAAVHLEVKRPAFRPTYPQHPCLGKQRRGFLRRVRRKKKNMTTR